jgi:FkbM family methyltransferase
MTKIRTEFRSIPILHKMAFHSSWNGWRGSSIVWKIVNGLKRPSEGAFVRTPKGFPIKVNSTDYISRTIYEGTFERDLLHFEESLVLSHYIIDIGANLGVTLYHACRHADQTAKFIAFEPSPYCDAGLEMTSSALKQSGSVLKTAIGSINGEVDIYGLDNPLHSGAASLGHNYSDLNSDRVEVRTIDDYFPSLTKNEPISFLKIDVETYEPEVINGGLITLQSGIIEIGVIEITPSAGYLGHLHTLETNLNGNYYWFHLTNKGLVRMRSVLKETDLKLALKTTEQWNLIIFRKDIYQKYKNRRKALGIIPKKI